MATDTKPFSFFSSVVLIGWWIEPGRGGQPVALATLDPTVLSILNAQVRNDE